MNFRRTIPSLLVAVAGTLSPLLAQTGWSLATPFLPITGPCVATYDPGANRAIVLSNSTNMTWAIDSQTGAWQQLTGQVGGPWYLDGESMTYDTLRDVCVLFGGHSVVGAPLADTWELDGTTWQLRSLVMSPPARHNAALCFDANQGVALLVAGDAAAQGAPAQPLGDAWTFDGTQWTQVAVGPGGPTGPATAAYDTLRQRIVILAENGTFEWVGGALVAVQTSVTPPPRRLTALVYDELRDRLVLHGGEDTTPNTRDDVWEFDGSHWLQRNPLGAPRLPHKRYGMVYDPMIQSVRLFAGQNVQVGGPATTSYLYAAELHYAPISPALVWFVGYGCTLAAPLAYEGLPWLGDVTTLTMPVTSSAGFAVFAFGFAPLPGAPQPLAAVGLPNCELYVAPDVILTVTSVAGVATLPLPIPNQFQLLAMQLFTQAFDLGPAGTASNALLMQIGGR